MRLRWTVLGFEVMALELDTETEAEDEPEEGVEWAGGSSHNFERDVTPLDVNERYAPDWDGFGFRR